MTHIVFRADASVIIGTGHIMRCLTLAHQLKKRGVDITFITHTHSGNLIKEIRAFDYRVVELTTITRPIDKHNANSWLGCSQQEDAKECIEKLSLIPPIDYLIIDHYAIDENWHKQLRQYCQRLMVIDDLANRHYDCDILLDQTLNRQTHDYQNLMHAHCQLLLGSKFMLLREEFALVRQQAIDIRNQEIESSPHILISMGGCDPDNINQLAINALIKLKKQQKKLSATVVISSKAPHLMLLKNQLSQYDWVSLEIDSKDMSALMLNANIAIGASGSTAWERCSLGLPCITIVSAENQQTIAENLSAQQAIINLGWYKNITIDMFVVAIENLLENKKQYSHMVQQCFSICDGQGTNNVINEVFPDV
ncbi:MAG: UDP-2,4-diacetamido-2,4,6-trideoxy-beta-L-altropyranose hydrolase [Colwellia sp.]|nr:UDP-2,4-diacetamido-2,4,6-trideoxy-beta-L-altropyranose hydrolase [Colwellia sp.]NQZ80639.1 UDP-2,4-diacetamido-2,4,6-trideoxy-beta-L-altropyranose hydrolase [Colwellia sp.]